MGVYTQSVHDYMKSLNFDPFKDEDLLKTAKSLGMYYYDSIPIPVMEKLLIKFIRRYMFNEFGWMSVDVFRLQLLAYMGQAESKYVMMFNTFKDLLPFEMLDAVSETTTNQITDNINTIGRDVSSLNSSDGYDSSKGTTNQKGTSNDLGSITNDSTSKTNATGNSESNSSNTQEGSSSGDSSNSTTGTSNSLGSSDTSNTDSGLTSTTSEGLDNTTSLNKVDSNNLTTDTKGSKITTTGKDAKGFGNIEDFTTINSGVMIEGTEFKTDEVSNSGVDSVTTSGEDNTNTSTDVTSSNQTTAKDKKAGSGVSVDVSSQDNDANTIGSESGTTSGLTTQSDMSSNKDDSQTVNDGLTINTGTSETTADSENTNKTDTLNNSVGSTVEKTDGTAKTLADGLSTTRTSGMNVWKPELARKFYDQYVSVDDEWIRGARTLFTLIY